jgi:branched-chain amino acid transport system permease protein
VPELDISRVRQNGRDRADLDRGADRPGAGRALFLYPVFLMRALCLALFACAFNLLLGYVGLLSFGHAAFFGMRRLCHRAYRQGLGLAAGARHPRRGRGRRAAGAAAFGWLAIRRQGIYFAMITLALAQMVAFFALEAPFTGGEDGIQAVPRGHLFGFIDLDNTFTMYYFVLAVF